MELEQNSRSVKPVRPLREPRIRRQRANLRTPLPRTGYEVRTHRRTRVRACQEATASAVGSSIGALPHQKLVVLARVQSRGQALVYGRSNNVRIRMRWLRQMRKTTFPRPRRVPVPRLRSCERTREHGMCLLRLSIRAGRKSERHERRQCYRSNAGDNSH